jgi:hypothetical protein
MDNTENTLRAVLKALTDVVGPAIEPSDVLAREQLRLVIDYVKFVQQRLDSLEARERFELRHGLVLARAVAAVDAPWSQPVRASLADAIAAGEPLVADAAVPVATLRTVTAALGGAARRAVRESQGFQPGPRRSVELAVLDASEPRIHFERAWYLPLGFDPAPGEVAPLEAVIAGP